MFQEFTIFWRAVGLIHYLLKIYLEHSLFSAIWITSHFLSKFLNWEAKFCNNKINYTKSAVFTEVQTYLKAQIQFSWTKKSKIYSLMRKINSLSSKSSPSNCVSGRRVVSLMICDSWTQNPRLSQNLIHPQGRKIDSSTYKGPKSTL